MSLIFSTQFTQRNYQWTDWKTVRITRDLLAQFYDDGEVYIIYGYDGPEIHSCRIWKGLVPDSISSFYSQEQNDSDRADFETNILPIVNQSIDKRYTYSASIHGLVAGANATDILTIMGSNNMRIQVTNIEINGVQTLTGTIDLLIVKRSSLNTGGTKIRLVAVSHSSSNPIASAAIVAYTANPKLGNLVGVIRSGKMMLPALGVVGAPVDFQLGVPVYCQPITLENANECISLNLNGLSPVGNNFDINIEWIEF